MRTKFSASEISLFTLFIYFVYSMIPSLGYNLVTYYIPYALCLLSMFMMVTRGTHLKLNAFLVWRIVLVVGALLSMEFVTINRTNTWQSFKYISLQSLVLFQLAMTFRETDILKVIKSYILAVGVVAIYMAFIVDYSKLLSSRLGEDVLGNGWNSNSIGMMGAYCALLISIVKKYDSGKKKIMTIFQIVLAIIVLLSGSRKAILIFVCGLAGLTLTFSDNRSYYSLFNRILLAVLVIGGSLFLVFEVPIFYNIIGVRLESLLHYVKNGSVEDGSIRWRALMNEYGIIFFKQSPVVGHGLNSFSVLFGRIYPEFSTYAHNNFIELMVDTGIIGLIIYYSIFVLIIKNNINSRLSCKNAVYILTIIILTFDYAVVSYASFMTQFLIMVLYYLSTGASNQKNDILSKEIQTTKNITR